MRKDKVAYFLLVVWAVILVACSEDNVYRSPQGDETHEYVGVYAGVWRENGLASRQDTLQVVENVLISRQGFSLGDIKRSAVLYPTGYSESMLYFNLGTERDDWKANSSVVTFNRRTRSLSVILRFRRDGGLENRVFDTIKKLE